MRVCICQLIAILIHNTSSAAYVNSNGNCLIAATFTKAIKLINLNPTIDQRAIIDHKNFTLNAVRIIYGEQGIP